MENENEDDLIMYTEHREIEETIWKVWDLLNDKDIIIKLLLNSSLLQQLTKAESSILLKYKDEKLLEKVNNNAIINEKLDKRSK